LLLTNGLKSVLQALLKIYKNKKKAAEHKELKRNTIEQQHRQTVKENRLQK